MATLIESKVNFTHSGAKKPRATLRQGSNLRAYTQALQIAASHLQDGFCPFWRRSRITWSLCCWLICSAADGQNEPWRIKVDNVIWIRALWVALGVQAVLISFLPQPVSSPSLWLCSSQSTVTPSICSYTLGQRIWGWPLLSEALKHEIVCMPIMAQIWVEWISLKSLYVGLPMPLWGLKQTGINCYAWGCRLSETQVLDLSSLSVAVMRAVLPALLFLRPQKRWNKQEGSPQKWRDYHIQPNSQPLCFLKVLVLIKVRQSCFAQGYLNKSS